MPEGPSIIILKEELMPFKGKKILDARGYSKIDKSQLKNKKVVDLKTWGKHFLICLPQVTIRIHLLLFGKYLINEKKKVNPVLHLKFSNGDVYFYVSSVVLLEDDLDDIYDWSADIMHKKWDAKKARIKLNDIPGTLACDAIVDQNIFSGSGNIIKNEALWRAKVHPESKIEKIPAARLTALIKEIRNYSFDFLKWRKAGVLAENWNAYSQDICPRCDIKLTKKYTGKTKRRSFFCKNCQVKY